VGSVSVWEAIFMLVVLKIPMVYLAVVVWWAVRAEPISDGGSDETRELVPLTPCDWDEWRRRRARNLGRRPFRPFGPVRPPARAFARPARVP
jgi:nitrogen fixation-related uncharacterized protein